MKIPAQARPWIWGFCVGAVVTWAGGFQFAGWTFSSTAADRARTQADAAVVSALTPICVAQSRLDPTAGDVVTRLKASASWSLVDIIKPTGWAVMPGGAVADFGVMRECANRLAAGA